MESCLPLCTERGIGVVVGGPYNSGVLATGPRPGAFYNYDVAPQEILDRVGRFTRDNKLSLYQKAHLGNRFKWALREADYAPDFVDAFTQEVVTVATLARKGR